MKPKPDVLQHIFRLTTLALAAVAFAGCSGIPTKSERQARAELQSLTRVYRPDGQRPALPELGTNTTMATLLTYAMLNQPRVEAAYYDYAATVERATVERSLPDPRLTLELDIQTIVTTVMPGLWVDLPWIKKLRLRADRVTAESQARYRDFETVVLQTAFEVKRAFYQLYFLNERLLINRETLDLVNEMEQVARAQNEVAKVTMQDVLRAQMDHDRLKTEIINLEDMRNPLLAQLKSALGMSASQPNPPVPARLESTSLEFDGDKLLAVAMEHNPRLKAIEAEVRQGEVSIQLAHQSKRPDFNLGVELDAKAVPLMTRPTLGVTLPIWRDKIAAEIAAAQAGKSAAAARLLAEQIQLAADFATRSFAYREATRNVKLLTDSLLPKARLSLDVARAGYSAGRVDFINLLDAKRTWLEFRLARVDARLQRELALAELSLLIVGLPPAGAPIPAISQPARQSHEK
ncbi:MAG: TolC family protein [Verrucomicrobia bacterium]|nr:TolC family protein [Verrucomicrobiota bacterium]